MYQLSGRKAAASAESDEVKMEAPFCRETSEEPHRNLSFSEVSADRCSLWLRLENRTSGAELQSLSHYAGSVSAVAADAQECSRGPKGAPVLISVFTAAVVVSSRLPVLLSLPG